MVIFEISIVKVSPLSLHGRTCTASVKSSAVLSLRFRSLGFRFTGSSSDGWAATAGSISNWRKQSCARCAFNETNNTFTSRSYVSSRQIFPPVQRL